MGHLSESQLGSVRTLIRTVSDSALHALGATLSAGGDRNDAMRMIQSMVSAETDERRSRNILFDPLAPICQASVGGRISFPSSVLGHLWNGLKAEAPDELRAAITAALDPDPRIDVAAALDALCAQAASGLRTPRNDGYKAAAAALERGRPDGPEAFAACLDLIPIARAALPRLGEWLGRATEERVAAARLAFKDATAIADDAGPLLLEILYAHLEEPWTVLRIISAVMMRPADRYVATSELASFGERLLDDIDERLQGVAGFTGDSGPEAGRAAGHAVRAAALEISEFDDCFELAPDGPWGSRLVRQKRALAQAVEGRLKAIEQEVAQALPLQNSGFRKATRGHPKLSHDPDEQHVARARALLTFMHEVRISADRLGFGASWNRTAENLQARLDVYIEDLLEKLRAAQEDENLERIRQFLDVAAEFMGLASDDKAAQIVRRRVAAAA